ncbi:hypothetical protein LPJ66_004707 [Kickxella alabastrina]|uniref:Uncharacterized protein n=1 Tax=Kickxella alabastrina TaxID=61397 RepID=A0ACC1ING8_9FUNG|nr:hypothetical protein LPJ66_004707 [Kickxella alabastrina]
MWKSVPMKKHDTSDDAPVSASATSAALAPSDPRRTEEWQSEITPISEYIEMDTLIKQSPSKPTHRKSSTSLTASSPSISATRSSQDDTLTDVFQEHHQHIKIEYNSDKSGKFSIKKLWQFIGPGLLVSQALLDPGNIESDISQADTSGYKLLWLLLLAHIICIFVQCLAARLGVITGRHLAQHIKAQYPLVFAVMFWAISELAIIGADIQEVIGTATALQILTGLPIWAGVVITAVDSFLFLYIQRFGVRVMELVFGLLVTVLAVCFWVEMFMIKPDAREVIKGMFIPRIPKGAVVQAVGIIGCVLMPHNLYLHSALVGSRKLDRREVSREGAVREAMRYFRIETSISLGYAYLINMSVVVVFCKAFEVLRMQGNTQYVASLADGASVLSSVLGSGSKYIYAVGLLAIGQSTTMSGTLSGQYVTEGFWDMRIKPWQRVLVTRSISLIPALLVAVLASSHMDMLSEIINVIQAVVLSFTIIPLLKFQAHAGIVGKEFVFGRVARVAAVVLTLAICALNAYMVASVIPLRSPGMYVALVATVLVYLGVLAYTAAFPLRCAWGEGALVDMAPGPVRWMFGRVSFGR